MFGTPTIIRPSASVSVGVVGPKGSSIVGAQRAPTSADGFDGDYFLALVAGAVRLYGPKASGAWPTTFLSLVGPQGAPGPQILSGGGAPTAAIGNNNDYYIDFAASVLYGPKTTGAWPTPGVSLVGVQGLPGPANTLTIGSITQLPPGATPTVTITGTAPNQSVNFGIPQGQPGQNGTGSGTVVGPQTSTAGNLPSFADGTGQNLLDSGLAASSVATKAYVTTALGTAASDTLYNSQDIRALYLILSGQTGADRLNGVATVADAFNDQSDVATATGATYDGTNHRFAPTPPIATVPNGTAISGGDYSGSYPPSNAFDGNASTLWISSQSTTVSGTSYIGQNFGSAKFVSQFTITQANSGCTVSSVNLQYSDNGSSWTTAATCAVSSTTYTAQVIPASNSAGAHQYWRLLAASATSGGSNWDVSELVFQTASTASGYTLQSVAFPSDITSPTKGRMLVQVDGTSGAFTPNADLVASVSRDGGTTFAAGTLAYVETLADGTKTYETGLIDISGQPAGSSMVWKVATANSKNIVVSGVVLQWRP